MTITLQELIDLCEKRREHCAQIFCGDDLLLIDMELDGIIEDAEKYLDSKVDTMAQDMGGV